MKTELLLVCNGQTKSDPNNQSVGWWSDLSLSPEGIRQAILLGERLKANYEDIDRLYASPLIRSTETAAIIADTVKVIVRKDAGLREIDASVRNTGTPGNGETYAGMHKRVTSVINGIVTNAPGKRIIVVTHGGPIVAYLRSFLGFGADQHNAPFFGCVPSSLHELAFADNEKTIVRLNEVSHLADAPR